MDPFTSKQNSYTCHITWPRPEMVVVLFLLMVVSCERSDDAFNENLGVVEVLRINRGANNPRNSEGDFIGLKDGRIAYVFTRFTGNTSEDHGAAVLAGCYSSDEGRRWSGHIVPVVGKEGHLNVMSVSMLRLQSGKIAMFYLRKNSLSDCIPMLRISDDEGITWTEPRPCITDKAGYFVLNNDRVIQLKSGRILMPVALHKQPWDAEFSYTGRLWIYYSDDDGATWTTSAEVPNGHYVVTQEPGLIELTSGEVLMFARTTLGFQYFSRSTDGGKTWSEVEAGTLRSPLSPASIKRIPSTGDLLAVWNDNGEDQRRTPLNIAISSDEGQTWKNNKILENDPSGYYCYTAIHFTEDAVLLAYLDWSTAGITVKRIRLDWLYQ